jgi:ABC-type transport system substrate-binding protein
VKPKCGSLARIGALAEAALAANAFQVSDMDRIGLQRGGGTAENPKAAYCCNPAEMPLINALSVELDPAKREKILHEALAALTENAPIIFLVEFKETMGFNPKIKNFSHNNLWILYEELRVDG